MNVYQTLELKKCEHDIVYFAEKYIHIVDLNDATRIKLSKNQTRILRRAKIHRKYILKSCRRFGKTTLELILALHALIFGKDENIVVTTTCISSAQLMSSILFDWIDNLPHWIAKLISRRPNVYSCGNNILQIVGSNSNKLRGVPPTLLIMDELAFYNSDMFKSIYPVVASSKKCSVKIFSSPKDRNDIVTHMYQSAEDGINDFVTDITTWKDLHSELKDNIESIKRALSSTVFDVEFKCQV